MNTYLLLYEVVENYIERRQPYRSEHLDLANRARERGELVLGGALEDPVDGAALVFRGESSEAARQFAEADPYVRAGLVHSWRVRRWNVVVGAIGK